MWDLVRMFADADADVRCITNYLPLYIIIVLIFMNLMIHTIFHSKFSDNKGAKKSFIA